MEKDIELNGLELNPNNQKFYRKRNTSDKLDESWFMGDKYSYLNIDERLALSLGNMMYGCHLSDLSYDDDDIHSTLLKCEGKSWNNLCKQVQIYYGINNHDIDLKFNLITAFRKFMNEFLDVFRTYGNPQQVVECRNEVSHLLRLWHLLKCDKNEIYQILDEFQLNIPVPIYDYMKSQLIKSMTWRKCYITDIMYWANRMILDYYIKYNLLK